MPTFETQVAATDESVRLVDEARAALDAFAVGRLNGFEIFDDPTAQRAHLAIAAKAVVAALAAIDGTPWPSKADLEDAEGED